MKNRTFEKFIQLSIAQAESGRDPLHFAKKNSRKDQKDVVYICKFMDMTLEKSENGWEAKMPTRECYRPLSVNAADLSEVLKSVCFKPFEAEDVLPIFCEDYEVKEEAVNTLRMEVRSVLDWAISNKFCKAGYELSCKAQPYMLFSHPEVKFGSEKTGYEEILKASLPHIEDVGGATAYFLALVPARSFKDEILILPRNAEIHFLEGVHRDKFRHTNFRTLEPICLGKFNGSSSDKGWEATPIKDLENTFFTTWEEVIIYEK